MTDYFDDEVNMHEDETAYLQATQAMFNEPITSEIAWETYDLFWTSVEEYAASFPTLEQKPIDEDVIRKIAKLTFEHIAEKYKLTIVEDAEKLN